MNTLRSWVGVLSVGVLTACGGGGGDGESSPPPASNTAPTTITNGNADQVTGAAINSVDALTTSGFVLMSGIAAEGAGTQTVPSGVVGILLREHKRWHGGDESAPKARPLQTVTSTDPCTGGGTVSTTVTYASPTSDTVGDTMSMSFNKCVDSGVTLNGSLSMTITALGSNAYSYNATFAAFSSSSSTYSEVLNGGLSVAIAGTSTAVNVSLTASNLSSTQTYQGITTTFALSGTNLSASANPNNGSGTYSMNGTFAATRGNNVLRATVTTLTPLALDTNGVFTAGKLRITGNASRVDATFMSSGLVKLDIDTNADGTIDATRTVSLSLLRSL